MNTFLLEIVTPQRLAYSSDKVQTISVPSIGGRLGILPNHTALFTQLVEGEVKVTSDKDEFYLAIGGGFVEVSKNKVIVLVTRAVHADEINEKEVLEAQKKAQELLKSKPEGDDLAAAQSMYRRSLIDMQVLRRRHGAKAQKVREGV